MSNAWVEEASRIRVTFRIEAAFAVVGPRLPVKVHESAGNDGGAWQPGPVAVGVNPQTNEREDATADRLMR
jgi:hypothetical protein